MSCRIIKQRLSEDVSAAAETDVQSHLQVCARCQAFHRELSSLHELSRSLRKHVNAPVDFDQKVYTAIRRKREIVRYWRPAFALALVLLFSVAILWVSRKEEISVAGKGLVTAAPAGVSSDQLKPSPGYVEVLVEQEDSADPYVVRVPSVINVRQNRLHHDFYLKNASH